MKRHFWLGLFVGCLSSLLLIGLGAVLGASAVNARASASNARASAMNARVFAMNAQVFASGASAVASDAPAARPAQPSGLDAEGPQGGGGAGPLGTAFTYQGALKKNGLPVNGSCDLRFKLFDSALGTFQFGSTLDFPNTTIAGGIFTVYLDFGDLFNGDMRYLETSVSCPSSPSPAFTALPRQLLSGAPYALSLRPGATISSTSTETALSILVNNGDGLFVLNTLGNNYTTAIEGRTKNGTAVLGWAGGGTSDNIVGVVGKTDSVDGYGVVAVGAGGSGVALSISNGGLEVTNAGIGSATPVFIHQVQTGVDGNVCVPPFTYQTAIDNALINGNPEAILIVTPNYGVNLYGVPPAAGIPAVYYDATNQCGKGTGKWVIYNLNSVDQVNASLFNVLAVTP